MAKPNSEHQLEMKLIAPKTLHELKLKQKVFNNKHNLQVQWQKYAVTLGASITTLKMET